MSKLKKRMRMIYERIDKSRRYNITEAIVLLKELSTVNFVERVDVAVNLAINARKSDQNVRGTAILPYGTGSSTRVAVFAQGLDAEIAKTNGAEMVGMEDLAEWIQKGEINFDVVIATPDAMHIVSRLGKTLGPRGLMPNPKMGTVSKNIGETIKNIKIGQIRYRNDKNGIIHATIGKVDFEVEKLKENLKTLLFALKQSKPTQIKGVYIKKVSISSTMGGSVEVDQTSLNFV